MSLIWLMAVALPLPGLYDFCPGFRYYFKFGLFYGWLMFSSLLMIPLSLTRPGSVENARLGARLMRPVSALMGIDWTISGNVDLLNRDEAFVIVCNHQSSVDLLGMFHIWDVVGRMAVIAKQSLSYYGTFGVTAYLCGTIFIDRTKIEQATAKINSVGQTLRSNNTKLWVFPEGTRNSDKSVPLLPFKKGAFHVAHNSGLPILPLVISKHGFLDEQRRIFLPGSGHISVLDMIQSQDKTVDQLLEETRNVMLEYLAS